MPIARELPQEVVLGEVLDRPVTAWVNEAEATAIYLTLRDVAFPDDDAYVQAAFEKNSRVLQHPLYRVLLRLMSAQRLQRTGAGIFARMHRGITSRAERRPSGDFWVIDYPPHLVPELIARCYATAVQAALELGGEKDVRVRVATFSPTRCELHMSYR